MLTRFFENAGGKNCIRFALVLIVLCFAVVKDLQTGLAVVTVPIIVAGLLLPCVVRSWLVDHFEVVRTVLNVVALLCIVAALVVPKQQGVEPSALRIALAAVFSLYMGVYFWVLSDSRIRRG